MSTIRQEKAAAGIFAGKNKKQAMLEAGYAPSTANRPKLLTESKEWPALERKYLPDELVAQKHNKGLNSANEKIMMDAVDKAYKVKGRYKSEADTADSMKDLVALNQSIVSIISQAKGKTNARKGTGSTDRSAVPPLHQAAGQPDVPEVPQAATGE